MVNAEKRIKINKYILGVLLTCFVFLSPLLFTPQTFLEKDNDLGRNYVPLFSFYKDSILKFGQIPLWNPSQMMGETVIGNPLLPIFYPPNVVFLVLPPSMSFFFFYLLHLAVAAIGTYLFARNKGIKEIPSASAAIFYALSIKMLMHVTAGHITMVAAFSYLPLVVLAIDKLATQFSFKWFLLATLSLTFTYFSYPTVFYYTVIFAGAYTLFNIVKGKRLKLKNVLTENILPISLSLVTAIALSAIVLIPQLEFANLSTRSSLQIYDIALPIWSFSRFVQSLFYPYLILSTLDHESLLYLGFVPSMLALAGFFWLKRLQQLFLALGLLATMVLALNLSTPIFSWLYQYLPLLKYSRVTTRPWYIVAFVVAILAALMLSRIKSKKVIFPIVLLYIAESLFFFYSTYNNIPKLNFANENLYKFLSSDSDTFRVYCTSYCLNPQLSQKYNLQLLNGETPIQQKSFLNFLQQAGGYEYNRFAVIFPPYQVWQQEEKPRPDAQLLGKANVKYIVSSYELTDVSFLKVGNFDHFYVYQNKQFKNRAYFLNSQEQIRLEYQSPNITVLKYPAKNYSREVYFSENYFPGWYAIDANKKNKVEQYEDNFRTFKVDPRSEQTVLKFAPKSFALGKTITFGAIVALMLVYFKTRRKNK